MKDALDLSLGPVASIPGVVRYDAIRAHRGYRLTTFLVSLRFAHERDLFKADPEAHMRRFALDQHERDLIVRRDFDGMLEHGASIYAIGKAGMCLGTDLIGIGVKSRGERREDFLAARLGPLRG